jgi:hypothetical protein
MGFAMVVFVEMQWTVNDCASFSERRSIKKSRSWCREFSIHYDFETDKDPPGSLAIIVTTIYLARSQGTKIAPKEISMI